MTTATRPAQTERGMRKSVVLLAAITLFAAAAAFTTPAAATEVKEAVKLCDNNPNCKSGPPDSTGVRFLNVRTSEGTTYKGITYIACPPEGDCRVLMFDPEGIVTDEIGGVESRKIAQPGYRPCSCYRSWCGGKC